MTEHYEVEISPYWHTWRMALMTTPLRFPTADKAREVFLSWNGAIEPEPEIGLEGRYALEYRIVRVADGSGREVVHVSA